MLHTCVTVYIPNVKTSKDVIFTFYLKSNPHRKPNVLVYAHQTHHYLRWFFYWHKKKINEKRKKIQLRIGICEYVRSVCHQQKVYVNGGSQQI